MTATDDPLAALRARFLERCRDDLAVLEGVLADPHGPQRSDLKFTVHRLSGTAGVFGFADLSALAAPIDECLHEALDPTPQSLEALADALRSILPR